jgi:hypothetical protein
MGREPGYPLQFLSPPRAAGFRYFRFYPLRYPKTASLPFLGFDVLQSKTSKNHYSRHPCRPSLRMFISGVLLLKTP